MNSIRTPRQGITANSKRIAEAVDDEEWQEFRVSMKGQSTRAKLDMLRTYWECSPERDSGSQADQDVTIRVDNYIKALCRGGLLFPGCDLETMIEDNWDTRWIKRS